jgi:hypothetical protein
MPTNHTETSSEDDVVFDPPQEEQEPMESIDPTVEGERLKEEGNTAFKAKRYGEAISLYAEAIGEYHSHVI